jgi:DNA polymerase III subunit beta
MKFICTQENLSRSLSIVGHLANKSVTLPILSHILIKIENRVIKFQTTNLELAITAQVRGKVDDDGSFTVPAKIFTDFISLISSNDPIECEYDNGALKISSKGVKTQIRGIAASEFPLIPEFNGNITYKIAPNVLNEALSGVAFAASASEIRPEISGVLFSWNGAGSLTLAATDSYRLSEKTIAAQGASEARDVIIPAKTCQEILRVISASEEGELIEFSINDNQISFSIGNTTITSRIIEGKYPDYKQIIPANTQIKIKIEKGALTRAIRSAGLFSKAGLNDVEIRANSETKILTVIGRDAQTGEETTDVVCEAEGGNASAVLNYRYLLDGLNTIAGNDVNLEIIDGNSPVLMKPTDKNIGSLYIVMPIKQ